MLKENRIAVFIDAENVTGWIKQGGVALLVEELMQMGQIIVRRAYGGWCQSDLATHQAKINQHGFQLMHCYHPVAGKNTADIQMAIDVIEYACKFPDINCFVLVTGDSDFSPVFRRLREMGKDVIGVGRHSALSECVKTSCSRFIYTDNCAEYQQQPIENSISSQKKPATPPAIALDLKVLQQLKEANDLVVFLLKDTKRAGKNTSQLKEALIIKFRGFDERNLGFKTFTDFLKAIPEIKLSKVGMANHATLA